jgi:hypothetical protein
MKPFWLTSNQLALTSNRWELPPTDCRQPPVGWRLAKKASCVTRLRLGSAPRGGGGRSGSRHIRLEVIANRFEISANQLEVRANRLEVSANWLENSANRLEVRANRLEVSANWLENSANRLEVSQPTAGPTGWRFAPTR